MLDGDVPEVFVALAYDLACPCLAGGPLEVGGMEWGGVFVPSLEVLGGEDCPLVDFVVVVGWGASVVTGVEVECAVVVDECGGVAEVFVAQDGVARGYEGGVLRESGGAGSEESEGQGGVDVH